MYKKRQIKTKVVNTRKVEEFKRATVPCDAWILVTILWIKPFSPRMSFQLFPRVQKPSHNLRRLPFFLLLAKSQGGQRDSGRAVVPPVPLKWRPWFSPQINLKWISNTSVTVMHLYTNLSSVGHIHFTNIHITSYTNILWHIDYNSALHQSVVNIIAFYVQFRLLQPDEGSRVTDSALFRLLWRPWNPPNWSTEVQECRSTGVQEYRSAEVQEYWKKIVSMKICKTFHTPFIDSLLQYLRNNRQVSGASWK